MEDKGEGKGRRSFRCLQACTIVGCSLIFLPNGRRWLWGNLTVYTSSYLLARGGHDLEEVNTPWMLSMSMCAWAVGVFVSGPLVTFFDRALAQIVGIVLFNVGVFCSYLSLTSNSVTALNVSFGFVAGVGDGIVETIIILVITDWVEKNQGLVCCCVFSCNILGSIAINQLATWYINPLNLKPELSVGESRLFTHEGILERTPSFLLIYLSISTSFHLLGLIFVRHHRSNGRKWWSCLRPFNKAKKSPSSSSSEKPGLTIIHNQESSTPDESETTATADDTQDCQKNVADVSPRQLVRMPIFHALWFGSGCSEIAKIWLYDYYKVLGLVYIPDDHFLTNIITIMAVASAPSRVLWGLSADRLGLTYTLLINTSLLTFVTAFYFLTPMVSRWLYTFVTLVFGAVVTGYANVVAILTFRLFGRTHFSVNYGLISTPFIVTNLVAPLVFQGLIDGWGWFPLLFLISCINAVSLLVQMVVLPSHV